MAMTARDAISGLGVRECLPARVGTHERMSAVDSWTRDVRRVVRSIPRGRVASYGLVAMLAGRPGAARAVGRVMSECDDPTVPCQRVVHADGSLAAAFPGQRARLRREGVRFAVTRAAR